MDKGALLLAASLLGVSAGVTQLCSIAGRCRRSWCVCSSSPPADGLLAQRFTPSNPAAGAQRLSFPLARAKLFSPPCHPRALLSSLFGVPPPRRSSWRA